MKPVDLLVNVKTNANKLVEYPGNLSQMQYAILNYFIMPFAIRIFFNKYEHLSNCFKWQLV